MRANKFIDIHMILWKMESLVYSVTASGLSSLLPRKYSDMYSGNWWLWVLAFILIKTSRAS